jgi:hypothetical protein
MPPPFGVNRLWITGRDTANCWAHSMLAKTPSWRWGKIRPPLVFNFISFLHVEWSLLSKGEARERGWCLRRLNQIQSPTTRRNSHSNRLWGKNRLSGTTIRWAIIPTVYRMRGRGLRKMLSTSWATAAGSGAWASS